MARHRLSGRTLTGPWLVRAYRCSLIPRVTVNRSTSDDGPFIKQSFSAIDTGFGCRRLLFMQILKGVVEWGPSLNASTIVM